MHVIVYCGYEGIDHILWAGEEGAREVCLRIRKRIADNMGRVGLLAKPNDADYEDDRDWNAALNKWYKAREKSSLGPWPWDNMDNPDRVCVMKEVGEFEYACCCEELGVGTGESWLY